MVPAATPDLPRTLYHYTVLHRLQEARTEMGVTRGGCAHAGLEYHPTINQIPKMQIPRYPC